ncbi:AraC-like DNA-binding protein [Hymenobacter luteus]|uniref:AraC-like DNA-binding protein n=2 Tax=Hymenobacter TaxID=89966 RepID=A0A7W9WBN2_9BACT|nr:MULTISPECIES: helix-turn-helix transcriptional regulator [Hymenobacter]MBB4601272.1 AraC-like DNA-binding protein [Hymenobacter latericoloratus]MBB6058521.1 AraC-like DNA-binding protein [Hymenobacter luteus]
MAFTFNLYSSLLLPFFLQGMVVGVVMLVRRHREEAAADGWLALLLLLQAVRLAQWMLGFAGWYDAHDATTTFMFYFPFSNWLAVGPAFYFYFRSLTNQEFRFSRQAARHFVPALAYLGWKLFVFGVDVGWLHGVRGQPLPCHFNTKGALACRADAVDDWVALLGYLSVAAYAWLTLREYRAYSLYLNNNFSDTEQIRFRWLRNVLVAVLIGAAVALGFQLVDAVVTPLSYYQAWYDYLFTGLLIYYLSIAGLLTNRRLRALQFQPAPPVVFPVAAEALAAPTPAAAAIAAVPAEANPPTHVSEPEPELLRWTERLNQHMATHRPYLAPELTLGELAAQLQTNTSWLSRVINSGCGQNFNDYINEYRVREAERRLRDPQFRHYTLLAIALESGFNSKSTFNRVFRKLRGATPSEVARQP